MNRIKMLRLQHGLRQNELAKIINVSQASLSGYENGKFEPDQKTLLRLAAYFHVSTDYLLGNNIVSLSCMKQSLKIPLLRTREKSDLNEAVEQQYITYADMGGSTLADGQYFGIRMQEDGMEPRIQNGDIVIAQRQCEIKNGDIAVLQIRGHATTVRKVMNLENGIMLIPYNPKYSPIFYANKQIETLPVIVMGKAIEIRGKC